MNYDEEWLLLSCSVSSKVMIGRRESPWSTLENNSVKQSPGKRREQVVSSGETSCRLTMHCHLVMVMISNNYLTRIRGIAFVLIVSFCLFGLCVKLTRIEFLLDVSSCANNRW